MSENTERKVESDKLSRDIESGAYFKNARRWYSLLYHFPIAERSYYTIVIVLALVNVYFALHSFTGIFPLTVAVPFMTYTQDALEDLPKIRKLPENKLQDKNEAVMKYFIKQYVINRESYDLPLYEWRYRNIWSNSTPDVFDAYKKSVAADNEYSPYQQYSNLAKKTVTIESVSFNRTPDISTAHLIFRTSVISTVTKQEVRNEKWEVDMKYKYSDFKVDQRLTKSNNIAVFFGLSENSVRETSDKSRFTPMTFTVYDYKLKQLTE